MTLRQWYACGVQFPTEGLSVAQASAVMKSDPPQWNGNHDDIDCVLWWAIAEAKYRFIVADAMIAEGGE